MSSVASDIHPGVSFQFSTVTSGHDRKEKRDPAEEESQAKWLSCIYKPQRLTKSIFKFHLV